MRRGFTLTELAIVLGVIGIILGAVWGAAANVYANHRVTQAVQQITTIVGSMNGLFVQGTIPSPGGGQPLSALAAHAGIIPSDMLSTSCAGVIGGAGWGGGWTGCAINPWGLGVVMDSQEGWGGAPILPNAYEILIGPFTASQCAAFLPTMVAQAAGKGLAWVFSDTTGGMAVSSATPITTFQNCSGDVVLQFTL